MESDYQNARWDCDFDQCGYPNPEEYGNSDVQDNDTDESICLFAPEFAFPVAGFDEYNDADVQPRPFTSWPIPQALCGIREYSLTLDAPSIDTTTVGEKYGEAVKSLVSGGGSFEFFLDRTCLESENTEDSSWMLMNMLFNTEGGCSDVPIENRSLVPSDGRQRLRQLLPTNRGLLVLQGKHPNYSNRHKCQTN